MMSGLIHNGARYTFEAAEALNENTLVALNSSGKLVYADAGMVPIGFTQEAVASGAKVGIYSISGMARIRCNATWTTGDFLKVANDGELTPESPASTKTVDTVAVAAEDAATQHKNYAVIFI